ncbi:MAG TPA: MBL fold metallo-hydrolase [Thermoanaerobaculia bacterium]|jgi:glyoxylase-like metal-dependent hydrolase (beta-lactamase superfamily II)|nr:MBL fold metallo-hydrolase [Thermoanaerobaculia bacterium]
MTARNVPPGLYGIRGVMSVCHLLVEGRDAWMLDTGMVGEPVLIRRLLRRLGLGPRSVRGILLTHGHLDHAGNLAALKEWTGAPVYGHPAEQIHVDGSYPYEGAARWCGRLEAVGRRAFGYRSVLIDEHFQDGDELPVWGGLRVVHLPGHTDGHCGFYSVRHDLLFSGDLFASYFFKPHVSPAIFTSRPELMPGSLRRALEIDPRWIVPNHYDVLDGELHKRRYVELCRKVLQPEG